MSRRRRRPRSCHHHNNSLGLPHRSSPDTRTHARTHSDHVPALVPKGRRRKAATQVQACVSRPAPAPRCEERIADRGPLPRERNRSLAIGQNRPVTQVARRLVGVLGGHRRHDLRINETRIGQRAQRTRTPLTPTQVQDVPRYQGELTDPSQRRAITSRLVASGCTFDASSPLGLCKSPNTPSLSTSLARRSPSCRPHVQAPAVVTPLPTMPSTSACMTDDRSAASVRQSRTHHAHDAAGTRSCALTHP